MIREEIIVRRRALWLLVILMLLITERSWSNESMDTGFGGMIALDSTYSGGEVLEMIDGILEISDEETLILLEEQESEYRIEEDLLREEIYQQEKKLSRWKTLLWIETGIIAGALLYRMGGE